MSGASYQDLTQFIAAMGGERKLRVEENLGSGFVRLLVAEAERRQARHDIRSVEDAVIELLRNSRDAGARQIYLATSREGSSRLLVVMDDGVGIPTGLHERVFDARVTSKLDTVHMDRWGVHGRGMALFSVRENAVEARVMSSDEGKGASIRVMFDTDELSERVDQSSWPTLGTDDEGRACVARGPHNIARTCCEFALEEHDRLKVYLGTPAEVVATAHRRARPARDMQGIASWSDPADLPIPQRLYLASDARELAAESSALGIQLSERTCHRILSGEIAPLRSVYARLQGSGSGRETPAREIDLHMDRRHLHIAKDDVEVFSEIMEQAFSYLSERYYLRLNDVPRVRVGKDRITVTYDFEEED